jgi:tRNA modification GTPase
MDQPTIFALSSGAGRSAVAIIRISGPAVRGIVRKLAGAVPPPRLATYSALRDPVDASVIDRGLVLFFPEPASFTGEDCCEFQVHGSLAVVRKLLAVLSREPGCRLAQPGEFAERGFANGKLDLPQVEALADLIDAETERQRQLALHGASGALGAAAERWRRRLVELTAEIEARIDFSDEGDVDEALPASFLVQTRQLHDELRDACRGVDQGLLIREGFRVVIAGPPNAGKSSLMNAMARRDVAIVSARPGTTRDRIEVRMDIAGIPVVLSDTAGLRETTDDVEQEGIGRTVTAMASADLILWLVSSDIPQQTAAPTLPQLVRIRTKCDLPFADGGNAQAIDLDISTRTGAGLQDLEALIQARAEARLSGNEPLITHARQADALRRASAALDDVVAHDGLDLAVQAEHLRRAVTALDSLVGRVGVEEVLGAIFSRFCIGK